MEKQYYCNHHCPFWDSGQGYDHSVCTIPKWMEWDCYQKKQYVFDPNDLLNNMFQNTISDLMQLNRSNQIFFKFRDYLIGKLTPLQNTTISDENKKKIIYLLEILQKPNIYLNNRTNDKIFL